MIREPNSQQPRHHRIRSKHLNAVSSSQDMKTFLATLPSLAPRHKQMLLTARWVGLSAVRKGMLQDPLACWAPNFLQDLFVETFRPRSAGEGGVSGRQTRRLQNKVLGGEC